MRYAVVIEKATENYSAYVPDLPGCVATGPRWIRLRRTLRGHPVPYPKSGGGRAACPRLPPALPNTSTPKRNANRGNATAADIENWGEEVRRRVRENSGVELEWEIKRIGVAESLAKP